MSDVRDGRVEIHHAGISVELALPSSEDHISKVLLNTGTFYEEAMLTAIAPALRAGDLVVDAGANIGNHTLYFAKVLGCRVAAFEPVPSTASILEENVRINGVEDRVGVYRFALGAQSATARIDAYDPSNIGGTSLSMDASGEIQVRALDDVEIGQPVRLIKVDVEGMDLAVLQGARHLLARDRPWVVCEAGTADAFASIRAFMEDQGFTPTAVFNATDTYLFLPSRTEEEQRALIAQGFAQMMFLQRQDRHIFDRLAQAGRYSERLKAEAIAESVKRLEALNQEQASMRNPTSDSVIEAQLRAKDAELEDARAALEMYREQAAADLADAAHVIARYKTENATLLEHLIESRAQSDERRHALDRQKAELATLLEALQVETAQRLELQQQVSKHDGLLARHVHEAAALQKQLTKAEGHAARLQREGEKLQQQLTKSEGLVARQQRELADKNRQLAEVERCLRQSREQARSVEDSASFRLGQLIASGTRTAGGTLRLVWRVPAFLLGERRRTKQ